MIVGFAPDHPSWAVLRQEIDARVARSITALVTPGLDPASTEFHRGCISALNSLVIDVEEMPIEAIQTPGYG